MSKQILNIKQTTPETFWVTSGTDERVGYTVNIKEGTCECPQNFHRGLYCKHQEIVDEHLISTEKIKVENCEIFGEDDEDLTCTFQQVMIDREYILIESSVGKEVWKKKEAYENMAEKGLTEIKLEVVDKHLHSNCTEFHLFDQSQKLNIEEEIKQHERFETEVKSYVGDCVKNGVSKDGIMKVFETFVNRAFKEAKN